MLFGNSSKEEKSGIELISINVFCEDEWFNGRKKFRKVFDRRETTFIYCEVGFLNKYYNKEDQKIKLQFRCLFKTNTRGDEEVCNFEEEYIISKEESIAYLYAGWGNQEPGVYWTLGDYYWEVYLNEKKLGTFDFYVNDVGIVTPYKNPYFEVFDVRLFNGGNFIENIEEITPLKIFDKNKICYLYTDLLIKNKSATPYHAEIVFRYLDVNGFIKGEATIIEYINANVGEIYHLFSGWGSAEPGTVYQQSLYFVDILFMGQIIARAQINISDHEEEGKSLIWIGNPYLTQNLNKSDQVDFAYSIEKNSKNVNEILSKLNALIGLEQIKAQIQEHILFIQYVNLRKEKGFNDTKN